MKALVVDDNPTVVEHLSLLLAEIGCDVRGALSYNEAVSVLINFVPDIVMLDYYMPGVDGLNLLRRIRTLIGNEARVAFVSAADEHGLNELHDKVEEEQLGSVVFLHKPLEGDELKGFVTNV